MKYLAMLGAVLCLTACGEITKISEIEQGIALCKNNGGLVEIWTREAGITYYCKDTAQFYVRRKG